jgi:HK97 family phage prohead protease
MDTAGVERRTAAEFRSAGPGRLEGYAAVYGAWSRDLGGFVESVVSGAFDRSLAAPERILALWEHDGRHVLGRAGARTLRLASDTRGLHFEIDLPPTTAGRDLAVLVDRGDVAGASFAFRVRPEGESWDVSSPVIRRSLHDVELHEITVTATPAYTDTSVAKRHLAGLDPWFVAARLYVETC